MILEAHISQLSFVYYFLTKLPEALLFFKKNIFDRFDRMLCYVLYELHF